MRKQETHALPPPKLSHPSHVFFMKNLLDTILEKALGGPFGEVEFQAKEEFGHYTTNVAMRLAKERKENPHTVAGDLVRQIEAAAPAGLIARIETAGSGFINIWLTDEAIQKHFAEIAGQKEFGSNKDGKDNKVIVEFSSPNMAKEMHAGHLRNNSLGEALSRLHEANGYRVIRWNYIGDWGTQFGKIITAYKMWGKGIDLNDRPIRALEALYVRFSEAEKSDPALTTAAREEFKKLEQGDHESREIWEKFRSASLKEMETIYQTFGIRFDEYIGESFFEKELQPIVKRLLEKGIAKFSQGAIIVPLDQFGLPPAMIQKSDGASLYLTRDIAALEYRIENYKPEKLLYVIGNEQTLAFQQLFAVSGLIGLDHNVLLSHVKYGLLLGKNGNKMSTREGTSVSINDMSEEAINRAGAIVREKNPDMPENERQVIAESIGLNALKYFMIREGRTSDIQFDWDKVLDFKGDSGPYLQYTYARLKRVLTKAGEVGQGDLSALTTEHELRLMRKMFQFPEEIRRSAKEIMTNNLTTYLYQLANLGNRFYEDQQILADENARRRNARLMLVEATASILKRGLDLLGIQVIDSI